jgi:hypothetical protein
MTNSITVANLRRATWMVFFASLAVGTLMLAFDVRAALLPVAVTFGWSQVCGL